MWNRIGRKTASRALTSCPAVGARDERGVALSEELAGEALRELRPRVPLAVLVAGVADDLAGEREELVAARQQRRHHEAQLGRRLVHAHLKRESFHFPD